MPLERPSPCKINLLLNVLGRRPDGFHELETVMVPVPVHDTLRFERGGDGIRLTCSDPGLAVDDSNLVHRAANAFFAATGQRQGVTIELTKRIPLGAGLGGGSGNAATTLLALNDLFDQPLSREALLGLAARLGSDVPFFVQARPSLATGRGERVQVFEAFPVLRGTWVLLIHPGFGVATPWAYRTLAEFPEALNGRPGRAARLIAQLQAGSIEGVAQELYNSLEAPVFSKYIVLEMYQETLRAAGALGTLMSGSGSTTFALARSEADAGRLREVFQARYGDTAWTAIVPLGA